MKEYRKTAALIFATAFILLAPLAAQAAGDGAMAAAIGEVVSLAGTVQVQQPDGITRKLELTHKVLAKDTIITGSRSHVEIVFIDDSIFSQGPESSTVLDEFVYSSSASKMLLKMGTGTFRYVTGQIVKQNPAGFALQTPSTTIGIRGTEVFAEATPEGEEIGVLSMTPGHQVDVSTASDRKTITSAGFSVKADKAGRLSDPSPTDPATRTRVIKAAPQTTQGELGSRPTNATDLDRRVEAFAGTIDRTKSDLAGMDKPDYQTLHNLSLQTTAESTAENDRDNSGSAGLGSDGGDGGGGGY